MSPVTRSCERCGEPFTVAIPSMRKRFCTRSCAIKSYPKRSATANSNWQGGKSKHPLYDIYMDMLGRCHRPTHAAYRNYGGRGITVCDRWRADFWAFVGDMGERPPGLTLDRLDNDRGYSPDNCGWRTRLEQTHNRRPEAPRPKCPKGHEYTLDNIRIIRGVRRCIICLDAHLARQVAAQKLKRQRQRLARAGGDA